jgi:ribosome-associated protein
MEPKKLAEKIVGLLNDKKALRTEVFYVEKMTTLADYYIVCSGTSVVHIKALANEVEEELDKEGTSILHKEGYETARWVLLDYGTVVVHILHEADREYYDLEKLFERGHESAGK